MLRRADGIGLSLGESKARLESLSRFAIYSSLILLYAYGGNLVVSGRMPVKSLIAGIGYTLSLVFATQGITIYQGYTLTSVEGNAEGSLVSAVFEADGKPQNITCDGLACYAAPNADLSVARALNENAIVYDGKLVVNAIFQSNDPAVMAAGSVTKFSRRYGAQLPVSCYNSREVGAALGRTVLDVAMFDGANLDPDTCPTFSQAKAKGCMLPSGLQYFHTARPGRGSAPGEGRDLVTEGTAPDGSVRFCCVHVDKFDVVESISYLGAPQSPV